jgi:hypothetical protein
MSRNNTKKVTSLAQALGCLVINGFNVDYDVNEYGETISVRTGVRYSQLPVFDYENITVEELVRLARNTIDKQERNSNQVKLETLSVADTLNQF